MPPLIVAALVGLAIFCVVVLLMRSRIFKNDGRTPVPPTNRRKEPRVPVNSEFDLFWQDIDASHKSARARGIEISEHGASVRSPRPIVCNSVIQVRARQVRFEGKAVVRRCERKGLTYIIGLQLEGSMSRTAGMRA